MASRKKPTLLAQGKPRTLDGSARPWRVRLNARENGGTTYQAMFGAPAGGGEPWKRVLRRGAARTKIRVAGFGGLRLGEQNALRGIDVFFDRGYVHVNGSWIPPRGAAGSRGPVKNHTLHEVPLPRSLMQDAPLPVSSNCSVCPRRRHSSWVSPGRSQYLGDKLTTVLNHYVRAGEDALRDSVSKLAER